MDLKTKTWIIVGTIFVISVMGYIIKAQHDTVKRLKFIETSVVESKNIGNGIIREQSSYVTKKDLERLISDQGINLSDIKKDMDHLGAKVDGISTVKIATQGYSSDHIESSSSTPRLEQNITAVQPDPHNYQKSTQWLNLEEPIGDAKVPFGKVGFSAWESKPWSERIASRMYISSTVLGKDKDGRTYAYTKFKIAVDGQEYTIPITEAKISEEVPKESFHFSPRLYLGVDFGAIANPPMRFEAMPDLGLNFFSYGKTKLDIDWTFLTLGLGYETQTKGIALYLSPVDYNVAKNLPFVDNLFLGPAFSLDPKGNFGVYLGVRVGL